MGIDTHIVTDIVMDTDLEMELGNFCQVLIAPYGLPKTYHRAISNSAILYTCSAPS
jgi:hypothetical protein